jgi:hypothetical protein
MNPSAIPVMNIISAIVIVAMMIVSFAGILSYAFYLIKHEELIKTKKARRYMKKVSLGNSEILDIYKQFERLVFIQNDILNRFFLPKNHKKNTLSARTLSRQKTLKLSGLLDRRYGAINFIIVTMIMFIQLYSMYLAASMQLSTLLVIGWGAVMTWLIVSAWISDLPLLNKTILSIFSPVVYFVLFIRLAITVLLAPSKIRISI